MHRRGAPARRSASSAIARSCRGRSSIGSTSRSPCRGRAAPSSPGRRANAPRMFVRACSPRGRGCGRTRPLRTPQADELLERAVERLPLSGRGHARVARVATTIAALAGAGDVLPEHVAEALSYRTPGGAGQMSELAVALFAASTDVRTYWTSRGRRGSSASARSSTSAPSSPTSSGAGSAGWRAARRATPPGCARSTIRRPASSSAATAELDAARCAVRRRGRRPRVLRLRHGGRGRACTRSRAGWGRRRVGACARGIDGAAHRGALETGTTVAVLGCGVDRDYPRAHRGLAASIAERGLIVSEYPPGVEPAPWRFPARNRIVAGLCDATVVVEARERSGALITADLALDEGREVLAVPGEITSLLSKGTNHLLRLGATPVTCVGDVLAVVGVAPVKTATAARSSLGSKPSARPSPTRRRRSTSSSGRPGCRRASSRRRSRSSSWPAPSCTRTGSTGW